MPERVRLLPIWDAALTASPWNPPYYQHELYNFAIWQGRYLRNNHAKHPQARPNVGLRSDIAGLGGTNAPFNLLCRSSPGEEG